MNKHICHLTSVHYRYDTRILFRECTSLVEYGYDITLLVADDLPHEIVNGVKIVSVGKPYNRITRFIVTPIKLLLKISKMKYRIIHFHDPELIFLALILNITGKTVIYDIHENVIDQIQSKDWLNPIVRYVSIWIYKKMLRLICANFTLILAEESYKTTYNRFNANINIVLNKPNISDFIPFNISERKENGLFYIGQISEDRGFDKMIEVIDLLEEKNIHLDYHFVGNIMISRKLELRYSKYKNVHFYGRLSLMEGYLISKKCNIGFSLLKPTGNYLNSLSTKIFEFMAISLPFIVSDFEIYHKTVKNPMTGLCANPEIPSEIATKIELLLKNKELYKTIQNNQNTYIQNFNWEQEKKKLITLYEGLL